MIASMLASALPGTLEAPVPGRSLSDEIPGQGGDDDETGSLGNTQRNDPT